jgi:hypothetical protein
MSPMGRARLAVRERKQRRGGTPGWARKGWVEWPAGLDRAGGREGEGEGQPGLGRAGK